MKTILSLLLLPIIVLAQTPPQHQEHLNIEFSIDVDMEYILSNEIDMLPKNIDDIMEIFITVEIYVEELILNTTPLQFMDNETAVNTLPQYLSTYSLAALFPSPIGNSAPQERLKGLLALNDPRFPKEDTLLDWLHPVRYQQNKFDGAANMPEGFGPRIRL